MKEHQDLNIDQYSIDELRQKLKEALKNLEENRNHKAETWNQVSTILSSIPLGLVIVRPDGTIEATNLQLRLLFEYETEELYGKPYSMLFPELKKLAVTGTPQKAIGKTQRGQQFSVEISINEVETQGGKRFCLHVKDITEKQKMLEYKMNLASMVSHDLRTPLTTMRTVISSINKGEYGDLSSSGKEAIKWALVSSDYMHSCLANILDAERIDSSEMVLNMVETSTGKIVASAQELCKPYADEMDILIETDITNDTFYADHARMVRVLVNLLSNAIKFSPEKEKVKIEAGLNGLNVCFRVIDRGPGIPSEMKPVIFDRFQNISKGGKVSKAGFGLGLSISKAFTEMHGGNIKVKDNHSKGSIFEVSIPYKGSSDIG